MSLRGLTKVLKSVYFRGKHVNNLSREMRWYSTKFGRVEPEESYLKNKKYYNRDLLKEFPEPKHLLHKTLSQALGKNDISQFIQYTNCEHNGVKKATVKLFWPCEIEEVGYDTKKLKAEQFAAAAACLKLREMGLISSNNQVVRRRADQGRGRLRSTFYDEHEDGSWTNHVAGARADVQTQQLLTSEVDSHVAEAVALFPHPKSLLDRVIQLATSSSKTRELLSIRTSGNRVKRCDLTLCWPEEMIFTAEASSRRVAEKRAAALACMKLKELQLLDKNNNPLTHAEYHKEKVREAGEREKRPIPLEIPKNLESQIKQYLAKYPVATEVKKLWEEEEEKAQRALNQELEDEEDALTDAITGRPYRPLSKKDAEQLNVYLQEEWERANPQISLELPVDGHRQRVVSIIQSSRVVVIAGETGCGKTTRIPRFLLEDSVRRGQGAECNILVTQPRRISAVSVAHRVAHEMGPTLKNCVGYQVRLESRPPEHSGGALLFLTVGVLLKKLQSNPSLLGISHVVVDEVHERDINTDLLLALLRSSLKENPHLRVVLMSATGENERLAKYFGGCPIVKVPGFMYSVKDKYLEDVLREMGRPQPKMEENNKGGVDEVRPDLDLVADVIAYVDQQGQPGAILCFLPGWQEIRTVEEKLKEKPQFLRGSQMILPLHSSLSVADQQTVFQRPQVGQRKIVLSTNIAETSITIDDVVHVVDAGTHKEHSYDPRTKVSCLDTVWISRANVTQRKGRAGRCQAGQSYHLFPRKQLESMPQFSIPEILRTPLESLVMQAKIHSPDCKAEDFLSQVLESPELTAIQDAVRNLQDIGVLDKTETLTPLGERVSCIACDPRLGKILVLSALFRCVLPMLSIVACLTRDPFYNSLVNRSRVKQAKNALNGSSYSDYLAFSRAVLGWRKVQQDSREHRDNYLEDFTLSRNSLRFINGLINQFSDNLKEAELVRHSNDCMQQVSVFNQHSNEDELLKAVLLAGLYPNLIKVKKGLVKNGRFRPNTVNFRTVNGPVLLHQTSVNRGKSSFPSRWLTFFSAVKSNDTVFVRDSSVVHPLALLLLTDSDIRETVCQDRVEVTFPGRSLVHCELSTDSWELLWELRTSIQAMLHRNLSNPDNTIAHSSQDGQLISLLVELLNNTDSNPLAQYNDSDTEVD